MKKTANLADILNYLLHKDNIRPSELARITGVPQPTVHRMVTGTCPRPHKASLEPISKHFDITVDQLKGLEPIAGLNMHKLDHMDGWATLPIVQWKHLSTWPKAEYEYQLTEMGVKTQKRPLTMTYTDASISTKAFAAYLQDNSMAPLFPEGSMAIFDPEKEKVDGCYILIRTEDDSVYFRRLVVKDEQRYYQPLNTELNQKPVAINYDDEILGVLAQVRVDY
jgi:plasmid maintenance system antidote protein VapI